MQNLAISTVVLTNLPQWQTYYLRFLERIATLHQARKISATEHTRVTVYLDSLNQALRYYFSLKILLQQTQQLQNLLNELQVFAETQKNFPVISELLTELKAVLIATKEELSKPMEIEKLLPEVLNQIACDNFTSRQTLNLAQCSKFFFFGEVGLSILAKRQRLPELSKFRLTAALDTCFLSTQNKLFVWGNNCYGQLGLGDNVDRNTPVEFDLSRLQLAPGDSVMKVEVGTAHTILLTRQGHLFVWGRNSYGQLGLGDNVDRSTPVEFDLNRLQLAPEDGVAQVVAGSFHTLLLTQQGRCFVWGYNLRGQLGLGDTTNRNKPVEFDLTRLQLALGDGVAQVVTSGLHTFLITQQGRLFVWGDNHFNQLGLGDHIHRYAPIKFDLAPLQLAPGDGVAQVVVGGCHTILFTQQGRCFVWGINRDGRLGLGDNVDRSIPVEFDLTRLQLAPGDGVVQVVGAGAHTILLTQQGRCFVWGSNRLGELGLGDNDNRNIPVEFDLTRLQLAPEDGVAQVVAGRFYNILFTRQGRCFVWGDNAKGQLGLGSDSNSISTPTEVFYPHRRELKNLWSSILKLDLATLASLACDEADYGETIYQLIVKRLASENLKTRLSIIFLIHSSPWRQLPAVTKLLPFACLYQPLMETLIDKPNKDQQYILNGLDKLLDLYNCFLDEDSSSDENTCQEDFVELLKTLSRRRLKDSDDLSECLEETAATRRTKPSAVAAPVLVGINDPLKNFHSTVFGISLDSPIPHFSAHYFTARQELLKEAKQQPEFLSHLTTAADIILQGLNAATEANGMAYTLRAFLQPKQELRLTLPSIPRS